MKYFSEILKRLAHQDYPLDYHLLRMVYDFPGPEGDSSLKRIDGTLNSIENRLGQNAINFLTDLMKELEKEAGSSSEQLLQKRYSIEDELFCAEWLTRQRNDISLKKLDSGGDILLTMNGNEWRIEVKSLLPMDFNLKCIEESLIGAMYLKKNEMLREWSKIRLHGQEINYEFSTTARLSW